MTGERVALVTGGTDGIGKATARRLLADGWQVTVVGRDPARGETTVAELRAATGNDRISAITADLSLLSDTRRAADEFSAVHDRLDLLLLNANAIVQEHRVTTEGFEWHLALVHLSRALLARRLEPVLAATPSAQVLAVVGLDTAPLDEADLALERGDVRGMKALARAQWANQMFTHAWNERTAVPMSIFVPGLVRTKILANEPLPQRALVAVMIRVIGITAERAADNLVAAAGDVVAAGRRDAYYWINKLGTNRLAVTEGEPDRVWNLTDRLLNQPASQSRRTVEPGRSCQTVSIHG